MRLLYLLVLVLLGRVRCAQKENETDGTPFRLQVLTSKILQELGMRRAPNITAEERARAATLHEASRLMELYQSRSEAEEEDEVPNDQLRLYAKKFNVYDSECLPSNRLNSVPKMVYPLYFNIPTKPGFGAHVNYAWLKVHLNSRKGCSKTVENTMTMHLYDGIDKGQGSMRHVTESKLSVTEGGWIRVNVSGFLHDRLNSGNSSTDGLLGLTLENSHGELENPYPIFGRYSCRRGMLESESSEEGKKDILPSVETSVVEIPILTTRQKRSLFNNRQQCKREPVYLSFSDIGWSDWVLQPQGFETGFCSGSCGKIGWRIDLGRDRTEGFSQRVRSMFECCAPSKMKSMKIVHFDDTRKLSLSVLENFLVTDCGCATGTS